MAFELLSYSQSPASDKTVVACLLPPILDTAGDLFQFESYSSASSRSSPSQDYPYSSWPGCYGDEERGKRDASAITMLYRELFQSNTTRAGQLLKRIQSQAKSIRTEELKRLLIPLLDQMLNVLDVDSSEARCFYESTMTTYTTRVVQMEPEKPKDWARPNEFETCYSNCSECQALRDFLEDPEKETHEFILSTNPWHLEYRVPEHCRSSKIPSQKPPVLEVRKTFKGWEEASSHWKDRASTAQNIFRKFNQAKLRRCLAEHYSDVMDLRIVRCTGKSATEQAVQMPERTITRANGRLRATVPQKRAFQDD